MFFSFLLAVLLYRKITAKTKSDATFGRFSTNASRSRVCVAENSVPQGWLFPPWKTGIPSNFMWATHARILSNALHAQHQSSFCSQHIAQTRGESGKKGCVIWQTFCHLKTDRLRCLSTNLIEAKKQAKKKKTFSQFSRHVTRRNIYTLSISGTSKCHKVTTQSLQHKIIHRFSFAVRKKKFFRGKNKSWQTRFFRFQKKKSYQKSSTLSQPRVCARRYRKEYIWQTFVT